MNSKFYTGNAAKRIDQIAIEDFGVNGFELMCKAGELAFTIISRRLASPSDSGPGIVLFCGPGNNGGDGYIIGRCALQAGWDVLLVQSDQPRSGEAILAAKQFLDAGGVASSLSSIAKLKKVDVVVDALLGVGISGALREPVAQMIQTANQLNAFKVAIDVPSGVDADTGHAQPGSFSADLTISFIVDKVGLNTGPAINLVGELLVDDLAIAQEIIDQVEPSAYLIGDAKKLAVPLARKGDSHKGHYGHTIVAGADHGMLGAAILAGRAALRCGSGKVTIVSTESHLDVPALNTPELMSAVYVDGQQQSFSQADVIVLGPGLGLRDWGKQVFDAVIDCPQPMVIDADALSLLAKFDVKKSSPNWVLTPHPGEAARLLGCHNRDIQADRVSAVKAIAERYGCVCVLKGAGTLIAAGDETTALCSLGNPGMASAGMGDVLSGIIASLIGQGLSLRNAAELGVWLHARTADDLVKGETELSLIASDIIEQLPATLSELMI